MEKSITCTLFFWLSFWCEAKGTSTKRSVMRRSNPLALILQPNGEFANVSVPCTAQELACIWQDDYYFPRGVVLHKMMHLNDDLKREIVGKSSKTISLALMCDKQQNPLGAYGSGTVFGPRG